MASPRETYDYAEKGDVTEDVECTTFEYAIGDRRAEIEKSLVRRQDMIIMPQMVILYLLAYLDRSNLGNAKLQGLVKDALGGNDDNYGWAASIFYFGYVIFAIPFTLYGKKFHPSRFMFVCVLGWGISASAAAGSFNFAGIAVSRFCIGLFEAGFAPSAVFYFTIWYTRSEVAFRTAIFVGMAALSGAFGGLIAYAISLIHSHLAHWRILFMVEGLPTVIFAFVILFFLPDRPETANFFRNEEERAVSIERMNRGQASEGHNVLIKRHILSGFTDWKVYSCAVIKMGHDASLATISVFLPNIIKSLGYTNTQAQYMTIGPYLVAWVLMLSVCFLSDKLRMRGPFIIGATMVAIIGVSLVFSFPVDENPKVALVGIYFLVAGIFPCIPLELQWATDNAGAESKKVTAICILVVAGHCWSILASKSFPAREKPRYTRGYGIVLAFLSLSCVMAVILSIRHRIENARRDKKHGKPNPVLPVDTAENADDAPMFRLWACLRVQGGSKDSSSNEATTLAVQIPNVRGRIPSLQASRLRSMIKEAHADPSKIVAQVCSYDGLSSRLVEEAGFPVIFLGGFAMAASYGLPDTGYIAFEEAVRKIQEVVRQVSVPVLVDGDTGYGSPMNVRRTVEGFALAGAAGVMIEDQTWPKRKQKGNNSLKRIVILSASSLL
ncbi:conserved hypothetical protein [Uncinocarpus reesii 1704]|uniref:Major facilitator superfamily (MFS) profile domain-containing protein n=1 Tax=Uncinocarpus reesii (strain UAMH 1704) TaxID=336963 RepID=C4JM23_UNCRE|nr:uncharacterized protein UREG_03881 [Uncinocarpus reesii 1704]EEP79035.1 conserved hypothetical protein [Uncinocarpus reesii 1704]